MIKLVFLRGPSAVGKTALAKSLLLALKNKGIDCAFISEDNFRKKMQFKYKAKDKIVHSNSVELIKNVIESLTTLDNYQVIILEGLFRYEEMIANYRKFARKGGYEFILFQLKAPLSVRKRRNKISKVRDHVADLESLHGRGNGEEVTPHNSIPLDTTLSIHEVTLKVISKLKL